jgi:hypothetical protein
VRQIDVDDVSNVVKAPNPIDASGAVIGDVKVHVAIHEIIRTGRGATPPN